MSRTFASLEELTSTAANEGWTVVDPGVPLSDFFDGKTFGPVWKSQPSVRKVVGFIARAIASLPFDLYRRTDEGRVKVRSSDRKGADLARFLAAPTSELGKTPFRLWESLLIDGLLNDYFVGMIAISPETGRQEIRRVPARRVRIVGNSFGLIEKVVVDKGGKEIKLDPRSLLIDIGYAERGVGGTSPVQTLNELLETQTEAVRYRRQMFKNGARLSGVIERPKDATWGDGARDRFKNDWTEFAAGKSREGGTALLDDGMTYKAIDQFRPRDTEDLESRRLTDIEVCSMYYVAPELLGIREGNFSNVKAFMQQLYGPSLGPYITAFEQTLNTTLLRIFNLDPAEFYVEANIESKLRGSFEEQAAIYSTATGRPWMTTNEVRARQNLSQIDGGDELVTPLNVLIGGQASPQDGETADGGGGELEALEEGAA